MMSLVLSLALWCLFEHIEYFCQELPQISVLTDARQVSSSKDVGYIIHWAFVHNSDDVFLGCPGSNTCRFVSMRNQLLSTG